MTMNKLPMHCSWDGSMPPRIGISTLLPEMGFCCLKCVYEYARAIEMSSKQIRLILRKMDWIPNKEEPKR